MPGIFYFILSFPSGLAVLSWPNRVHFRCRLSGSIRCSPPRLTATQLLQVLTQNTVPDGRGLPPRRIVTLNSALGGQPPRRPHLPPAHTPPPQARAEQEDEDEVRLGWFIKQLRPVVIFELNEQARKLV